MKTLDKWLFLNKIPTEITLDALNENNKKLVLEILEKVYKKYPFIFNELKYINFDPEFKQPEKEKVLAYTDDDGISFTTRLTDNEFLDRYNKKQSYCRHPIGIKEPIQQVICHELGHVLEHIYNFANKKEIKDLYNYNLEKMKEKSLDNPMSTYSAESCAEFFCEAFSEYMCSDNPRTLAKEIGKIIDNTIENVIVESAPPDKKIEKWIMKMKPIFKKEYPDDWEAILYGRAWKMYNKKHS